MTTADDVRRVMDRVASIRKLAAEGYLTPKGDMADLLVLADEREELIALLAEAATALDMAGFVQTANLFRAIVAAVRGEATGEQHV